MRTHPMRRFAAAVSTLSLGAVFTLFIVGVVMRYAFDRPVSWIDEAVTVLTAWCVLWTGAFVLRWPEHISFDIIFIMLSPRWQRAMLIVGHVLFIALMGAALPGMYDYTLFLSREKTDMLEMRLDFVYMIFPVFFTAVLLRLLVSLAGLVRAHWRKDVAHWGGAPAETQP